MLEVCGDGINLGKVECDDGNTISGDCCSADCKVEFGCQCRSQGVRLSDVCWDNVPPRASIDTLSKNNTITIAFTETVVVLVNSKDEYDV